MKKKKNEKKTTEIIPSEPMKEISLSPEEVTQMFNDSATKEEKVHEIFPLFSHHFRWGGLLLSASVLGFAIFHGITKLPNFGNRLPEFQTFTLNVFILGFILRCASKPKNEDKIINRIRINSFAGAAIFAMATNCIPVELILGMKLEVSGIHILMIQFLVAFNLSFIIQKAGKGYQIKHPFKLKYYKIGHYRQLIKNWKDKK